MLLRAAEEILGRQRKKIQLWATNEVLDLCHRRRQLKQQKYTSTEAGQEYRRVNRDVGNKMNEAKKEWNDEQCEIIKKQMMLTNSKEAYNTLKTFTKTQTESTAVLDRWTEYWSGLYSRKESRSGRHFV